MEGQQLPQQAQQRCRQDRMLLEHRVQKLAALQPEGSGLYAWSAGAGSMTDRGQPAVLSIPAALQAGTLHAWGTWHKQQAGHPGVQSASIAVLVRGGQQHSMQWRVPEVQCGRDRLCWASLQALMH